MKISEFSVKHPVIIGMFIIVLAVFGILSVSSINVEFMGDISVPSVIVVSVYPGADAEDIEEDVTRILEDDFVTLPDFKGVSSESANSVSTVTITFRDGIDPYDKLGEVRDRINRLMSELPDGLAGMPRALVGGAEMLPIFTFSVSGGEDQGAVTNYIEEKLRPKITSLPGVSQVAVSGGKELQVSVELQLDQLAAKNISALTVYQILNYSNVSLPAGKAIYNGEEISIRYQGGITSLDDIRELPVGATDDNIIIRLGDVAKVDFAYPKDTSYVSDGTNPLILVDVNKRADGNTMKIVKSIKKILHESEEESNGALEFNIISDDSRIVKASMSTVIQSGIGGIFMAIIVIFLFLADFRATLIIGLSIPLSILFTFVAMKLTGVTVNLMSLSGMVVALGMVVDGSIVMLEEVFRYYSARDENGMLKYSVTESIFNGANEVGASIFASTATTVVVFIPIVSLSGIVGMILKDVSLTLIMALSASFLSAVIVVPFLMKLLLKEDGPKEHKLNFITKGLTWLEVKYRKMLDWSLTSWKFIVFLSISVLVATLLIVQSLGIAFIPSTDNGDFYISLNFPNGYPLTKTREEMRKVSTLLYNNVPEVENAVFYTGKQEGFGGGQDASNAGYVHVVLVPVAERDRNIHDIILQMQELVSSNVPGATVKVSNGGFDKLVGYVSGGGGYGMTFISEDMELLYNTAKKLEAFLKNDKEVVSVEMDTNFDAKSLDFNMVHEYMSSLGVSSYEAGITSTILFQGMDVGSFRNGQDGKRYNIKLFSDKSGNELSKDDIVDVKVTSAAGVPISFANISDIEVGSAVSQINHKDRAKKISVSATLTSEDTSGVNQRVNQWLAENPLPPGVENQAGGIMELIGDAIPSVVTALAIAWFLVYTVMVLQFERFRQPFIVMATIPFCLIGVILGLLIFGSSMNLVAFLGVISLGGVVVNNGIILIDYINMLRKQKDSVEGADSQSNLRECVILGSASRIKPIFMTTLTTMLGVIPMAVANGEGAEIYKPLGQAIAGGLLTSTLITLFIIPVLYYITEKRRLMKGNKKEKNGKPDNSRIKSIPANTNLLVLFFIPLLFLAAPLHADGNDISHTVILPRTPISTGNDNSYNKKYNYDDLRMAMEYNNGDLKKAEEDLIQAQLDVKDAKAGYQPNVDLTFGLQYDPNPMSFSVPKGLVKIDEITIPAISIPSDKLPPALFPDIPQTTVPMKPPVQFPDKDTEIELSPMFGYTLNLGVQQPVYTWGKITNAVNLYSSVADVRALQLTSKKAQLNAELKANLAALYYLQEIEKLLLLQQDYVTDLVKLSENGYRQGALLKQDVLEAKMQAGLVPVTVAEIDSNKHNVIEDLCRITGIASLNEDNIYVTPDEDFFYSLSEVSVGELEAMALDPKQETFLMLDTLATVNSYGEKIAKGSFYGKPDIALQGSVGFMGDLKKLFTGKAKFDDSFKASVSIGLKTTLWDGGKIYNNIKRSESKFNSAVIDRENAEVTVRQELNKQYNALNIAKYKIEYQELKIDTAEAELTKAKTLVKSGYGSKTDVLKAEINKNTEQINMLKEKLNMATAAYTIEALIE